MQGQIIYATDDSLFSLDTSTGVSGMLLNDLYRVYSPHYAFTGIQCSSDGKTIAALVRNRTKVELRLLSLQPHQVSVLIEDWASEVGKGAMNSKWDRYFLTRDGNVIVACPDKRSDPVMVFDKIAAWKTESLFRGSQFLGLAPDIAMSTDGKSILGASSGSVVLFVRENKGWKARILFKSEYGNMPVLHVSSNGRTATFNTKSGLKLFGSRGESIHVANVENNWQIETVFSGKQIEGRADVMAISETGNTLLLCDYAPETSKTLSLSVRNSGKWSTPTEILEVGRDISFLKSSITDNRIVFTTWLGGGGGYQHGNPGKVYCFDREENEWKKHEMPRDFRYGGTVQATISPSLDKIALNDRKLNVIQFPDQLWEFDPFELASIRSENPRLPVFSPDENFVATVGYNSIIVADLNKRNAITFPIKSVDIIAWTNQELDSIQNISSLNTLSP